MGGDPVPGPGPGPSARLPPLCAHPASRATVAPLLPVSVLWPGYTRLLLRFQCVQLHHCCRTWKARVFPAGPGPGPSRAAAVQSNSPSLSPRAQRLQASLRGPSDPSPPGLQCVWNSGWEKKIFEFKAKKGLKNQ